MFKDINAISAHSSSHLRQGGGREGFVANLCPDAETILLNSANSLTKNRSRPGIGGVARLVSHRRDQGTVGRRCRAACRLRHISRCHDLWFLRGRKPRETGRLGPRLYARSDVLRFFDIKLTQAGFVDTDRFSWFLHSYVATEDQRIEDMPKKFAAVSTDLDTGSEVWFTQDGLADAVRASMANARAIPGGLRKTALACRRWPGQSRSGKCLPRIGGGYRDRGQFKYWHRWQAEKRKPGGRRRRPTTGILSNIKQQAKEYSNSIFPNRDESDEAPGLFQAIANSINIFQDRITRSTLARRPGGRAALAQGSLISACSSFTARRKR